MSNKLKCSLCDENATVHLTQIINNQIQKIDLCESCAQKKGVTDSEGFSLAEMLSNTDYSSNSLQQNCKSCGLMLSEFKKSGRFGCTVCYTSFESFLEPILDEMHIGNQHIGKLPVKCLENISKGEQITLLEEKLQNAIKCEAYEDAALYRDELNALMESLNADSNNDNL
ncbi:MAG: UvrB/UvrC motif-containing protein [Opitutae bacterium]|jgi:protein arginine kinase activator|nr:UvrB/UvrC motif-containing protein [Opitutae bacterium]